MVSGPDLKARDHGSLGKEKDDGSDHVSHAAAVATISMDPTAAEATDDGTGEEQRNQGAEGPSSSSDNNRTVAEPQQSGQKGSIHAADRVRGGNAGLNIKDIEGDNSRNASGELGSSSGSNSLDDGNCSNTAEGGKEVQDGSSGNQPTEKQQSQKTQQQPGPPPKTPGSGSENNNRQKQAQYSVGGEEQEPEAGRGQLESEGGEQQMQGGRPVLKKPDKLEPCPRCDSYDTKFCYYNNYNIKQPRHFCKNCQRYWTAGGTLRNVPVGAGRRKNKHKSSMRLGPPGSGSDSELIIPSSSGGEDYLMRSGSIRSSNPTMGAPVFKAPSPAQGFQGRFTPTPAGPMYDSPNDKSGVTNARRDGTSADEMQSGDQFRGGQYAFRGDEFARGGAQAMPESDPRRPAKRVKRASPEGEGLGVPVARFGRGVRETSECASSPNDLMLGREGTGFANEVLLPPESGKTAQSMWMQQPAVPVQGSGGAAFGGGVNDMCRWNQGANVAATPTGGWAPSNPAAAPWGGMWNQPWPYTMPMGNWNASGGAPVMNPPGGTFTAGPQGNNWGMAENAAFSSGANWGAGQANAANVAGAAAAWANANVWAGLAAAGNAWGPPWAAWMGSAGMFGAGPAAAAIAPSAQPVSPVLGKHRREEGGEGEHRDDGVWVPKIVRTEAVRGNAPQMQWQQQLAGQGDTGFLGLMKNGETGGAPQGQDGKQGPELNLL